MTTTSSDFSFGVDPAGVSEPADNQTGAESLRSTEDGGRTTMTHFEHIIIDPVLEPRIGACASPPTWQDLWVRCLPPLDSE